MEKDDDLNFNMWIDNFHTTACQFDVDQLVCVFDTLLKLSSPAAKYLIVKRIDQLKVDFTEILPPELLELIFSHLDIKDVENCCLVNKQWNRVVSHSAQVVWRRECVNHGLDIEKFIKISRSDSETNTSSREKDWTELEGDCWKGIYQRVRQKLSGAHRITDMESLVIDCRVPIAQHSPEMFYQDNKIAVVGEGLDNIKMIYLDVEEPLAAKLKLPEIFHLRSVTDITCLKFDSELLVAGCSNGHVAMWSMTTGDLVNYYPAIPSAIKDISFCQDSNILLIQANSELFFQVRMLYESDSVRTIERAQTQAVLQTAIVDSLFHKKGETMLITLSSSVFQLITIWPPFTDPGWFNFTHTLSHVAQIPIKSYSNIRPQMVCNGRWLAVTHTTRCSGTVVTIHSLEDFTLTRSINSDDWALPKDRWINLQICRNVAPRADITVCSFGNRFMLLRRSRSAVYCLMETQSLQLITMIDLAKYSRSGEEIAFPLLSSASVYNTEWFENGFSLDENNLITLIVAYKNTSTLAKFDISF